MFWIRYSNAQGQLVEASLDPSPTEVEYPEGDTFKVRTSRDGAVIIQRPMSDSRPRQVGMAGLWAELLALHGPLDFA
jgi:hypothetical protein